MTSKIRKKNILFFFLTLLVGNHVLAQQAAPDLTGIRKFARWRSGVGGLKGGKIKMSQKLRGTPEAHKKALEKIPIKQKFDASKQQAVKPKIATAPQVAKMQTAQDILLKKAPTSFSAAPSTVSARQNAFKTRMAGYRGRFKKSKFATDMGTVKRETKVGIKKMPQMALTSLKPSVPKRLQKKVLTKKERKALTQFGRGKKLTGVQQQAVVKLKSAESALMDAYYKGAKLTKKQLKMVAEIQKAEAKQTKRGAPKRFFKRKGEAIIGTVLQEYEKHKEGLPQLAQDYAKIKKLPGTTIRLPGKAWTAAKRTGRDIKSLKRKSFSPTHRYKTSKKQMEQYKASSIATANKIEKEQMAAMNTLEAAQRKYDALSKTDQKSVAGKALKTKIKDTKKVLNKKLSVEEQDAQRSAQRIQMAQAIGGMGKEEAMTTLKGQAKMGFGYGGMKSRLKSAAISGATQALGSAAQIGIQQGISAFTKKYEKRPEKRDKFVKPQFDPVDDDIVIESK